MGVLLQRTIAGQRDGGRQAGLLAEEGTTSDLLLGELRGALSGHHHVGAVGQHEDLLSGNLVDRGEQLVGGGVQRGAPVEGVHAELAYSALRPSPLTTATAPQRTSAGVARGAGTEPRRTRPPRPSAPAAPAPRARPGAVALGDLGVHVGDVEVGHLARVGEYRDGALGLVGVDVDLQGAASPTTRTESPSASSGSRKSAGSRPLPVTAKFVQ